MGAIHQALLSVGPSGGGAPTTLIFDDFNRADSGTLGTCVVGTEAPQAWAGGGSGGWSIASNRALFTRGTPFPSFNFLNVGTADCTIEATLAVTKPNNGIWFRGDSSVGFLFINEAGTKYTCYRKDGGGFTLIFDAGVGSPTPANGDVLKVVLLGSLLTFYVNGINEGNAIDSFKLTQPNHGFYGGTAAGDNAAEWDNFTVTSP